MITKNIMLSRAEKALSTIALSKRYSIIDFQVGIFGFHIKLGTDSNGQLTSDINVIALLKEVCNNEFLSEYQLGNFTETTLINNVFIQLTIAFPDRDIIINLSENGVQKCEIHFLK